MSDLSMNLPENESVCSLFRKAAAGVGARMKKVGKAGLMVGLLFVFAMNAACAGGGGGFGGFSTLDPDGVPANFSEGDPGVQKIPGNDGFPSLLNTNTGILIHKTPKGNLVMNTNKGTAVLHREGNLNDYYRSAGNNKLVFVKRTQGMDPITAGIAGVFGGVARGAREIQGGADALNAWNDENEQAARDAGFRTGGGPGGTPYISVEQGYDRHGNIKAGARAGLIPTGSNPWNPPYVGF